MPPVGMFGSRSSTLALNASATPRFCTLRVKSPGSAGFIVTGPDLSSVSTGVPGGKFGNVN